MRIAGKSLGCASVVVLLLAAVSTAMAKYSGGTGEPNDPYQIATAANGSATYLLITNNDLAAAFEPLVERRTSQGLPGKLVTVENIYVSYPGADEPEQIRKCVMDHYLLPQRNLFIDHPVYRTSVCGY